MKRNPVGKKLRQKARLRMVQNEKVAQEKKEERRERHKKRQKGSDQRSMGDHDEPGGFNEKDDFALGRPWRSRKRLILREGKKEKTRDYF